jgi:hypothetical protein
MSAGSLPVLLLPRPASALPAPRLRERVAALAAAIALIAPLALYGLNAAAYGDWLIDDAGITFAYARNLAAGHGLVAQPGAAPVEGFSNPAWTLLLALFFAAGAFDPVWTPKLVAGALVALAFALVLRTPGPRATRGWNLLPLLLLAVSTPFVAWTTSGLENALLAALCAWQGRLALAVAERERAPLVAAGACAALLALTRPDAIVLAAAVPALIALPWLQSPRVAPAPITPLVRYFAGFVPPYAGYLLFRRGYFGEWVPNTYFAKEKPALVSLLDAEKWLDLLAGAQGRAGLAAAAALACALCALPPAGRRRLAPLALLALLAAATFVLMPPDWMGEYRFATPFVLFFAWAAAAALREAWLAWPGRASRLALALLAAGLVAESLRVQVPRAAAFASWRITPFSDIAAFAGHGYNRLAATLEGRAQSLLAPDLGGALFHSELRVHDLVGLCDATIARTLTRDTAAFHRYVFDELRPTFIHVHGPWSGWAALHDSTAFRAEYLAIHEAWGDGDAREPVRGDYVRRAALGPDAEAALRRLRDEYQRAGLHLATF